MQSDGFEALKRNVIDRGLCHGCGTCVGACPTEALAISYGPDFDADPEPVARKDCQHCGTCYNVCPGKYVPLPEIDTMLFGRRRDTRKERIGIIRECLGGFARNEQFRTRGAGGGAAAAILAYAFEHDLIDEAIVSVCDIRNPGRVLPKRISSPQDLPAMTEYGYSLVPVNSLLRSSPAGGPKKRVALVGLPCHIHGFRKIQLHGDLRSMSDSVVFTIGVFCPTNFFWEYTKHVLVEKCGIDDFKQISQITFHGGPTPKHLCVSLTDGREKEVDTFTHLLWGLGNFVHQRCAVCIDWTGETADISLGELWEPWLNPGAPGWSTILSRTGRGDTLVQEAQKSGFLYARPTPQEFLIAGYAWEIKHHANAYRLYWRGTRTPNPVPNYGYPLEDALTLRDARTVPWRINARLHGLINGVPVEESR